MSCHLLLANPRDPGGRARAVPLELKLLQTSPGGQDITVSFQPNRGDDLHASAKAAGELVYRILFREGMMRSQLVVRCRLTEAPTNVMGRSADLVFALAMLLTAYEENERADARTESFPSVAATGVLEPDGSVRAVDHLASKLEAAFSAFDGAPAIVFFPAENAAEVDLPALSARHPNLRLRAIGHLDQALEDLDIVLERVYLRNPFRGLEYFDYEHRAIFFGRDAEIRELTEQLVRREAAGMPGVLVEGASGSGKSSFMRAGLLPALVTVSSQASGIAETLHGRPVRDSVRQAIWRAEHLSSAADEEQVAQSILECWRVLPEFGGRLPSRCSSLNALAEERHRHWPASQRFVWLIDQFEELFVPGFAGSVIDAVGRFLVRLQKEGVWTLACIRADTVPQLKQYATIREVFGPNEGHYYLETMRGAALDDVIARPTDAAGLTFGSARSGKRLDHVLREEGYATGENTLPLLQFTLHELYRRRSGTVLQYETYEQLGGLSGSVATAAEAALQADVTDSEMVLPRIFRSLVSVDEDGRPSRRYAPKAEITGGAAERKLLDRLVSARLCVTDQRQGSAVVAFAHEALLRTWPRLRDWLTQEGALLKMRELAWRETRLWLEHGRSDAWLATADKVIAFKALETAEITLAPEVRSFIDRSRLQARRTARIKQAAVALIALLAVAASVSTWVASRKEREAEYQGAQARKAQLQALTQVAAERLKDGDLALARGVILEVLRRVPATERPDPETVNVFQEVRANDPTLAVLQERGDTVASVAYSPDGARILTGLVDHTARIWDARSGTQLRVLYGHTQVVRSAFYSPDGKEILTSSLDGTVRGWDAFTGSPRRVLSHLGALKCARYSPDAKRFLTSDDETVRVFDTATGVQVAEFAGLHPRGCPAYSPDGKTFTMASSADLTARIWDARTGALRAVLSGSTAPVNESLYSPDGKQVVAGSDDGIARTWDARTGAPLLLLKGHGGEVWFAAYSPDGTRIATTAMDKTVRIWDAATGVQLSLMTGHTDIVGGGAFSPDGRRLITGGWDAARIWDLTGGPRPVVLSGHTDALTSIAYSPDGRRLATASVDQTARLWDPGTGAQLAVLSGHVRRLNSVAYSRDGSQIVTTSEEGTAKVWDARTAAPLLTLSGPTVFPDLAGVLLFASYSPDGARIVGLFGNLTFGVWDARSGKQLALLPGHHAGFNGATGVGTATYSPDGSRILTGTIDKTARLWDAKTFAQLAVLPHSAFVNAALYSPDGSRIVTAADDSNATVWDAASGARIGGLSGHHARVACAAFSPDGSRIATGSADSTVRIWDAHSLIQLAVLGSAGSVNSVAWSPDGTHVASASDDNTARVWETRIPGDLQEQILWALAAEPDPLSDALRTQLGFSPAISLLGDGTHEAGVAASTAASRPSPCDVQASAFYDPDRRAPGVDRASMNPELASATCVREAGSDEATARTIYQAGRAAWANGQTNAARQYFERALAGNYPAARVDLALLLTDPSAGAPDPGRAVALLRQAWDQDIAIAGFELGALYERGVAPADGTGHPWVSDPAKAASWYQEAAKRAEPSALARLAQRAESEAITGSSARNEDQLLTAFTLYARATARAEALHWPADVWRPWRYRRASLARVLAADGMMQQVANAYKKVLDAAPP